MKNYRLFRLAMMAPALMVPLASGCVFLKAPPPQPTPTPAPQPTPPFFDPTEGQPAGLPLNKDDKDPTSPDYFRFSSAISGDAVALQAVKITPASSIKPGVPAKDTTGVSAPEVFQLAGIVAPDKDPGLQAARSAIAGWLVGQNLDVQVDPKFSKQLDGKKMVQVFFIGRKGRNGKPGPYEGVRMSLNRMLVRSGLAVVDLYSPTAFDTTTWIYDEGYARDKHLGVWGTGQLIQQRIPLQRKSIKNSASNVDVVPQTGSRPSLPPSSAPAPGGNTGGGTISTSPTSGGPSSSSASTQGMSSSAASPAPPR